RKRSSVWMHRHRIDAVEEAEREDRVQVLEIERPTAEGRAQNPRSGILPADCGGRVASERDVRSRIGRSRPELRQVRLVPDLPRRTAAKMPGRRAGERGKRRASALCRGRQSVVVKPVAVVQDEERPYTSWLERIQKAIPGKEVISPGLRLRSAPR